MKTIGFLGYSPASVNVLLPLMQELTKQEHLTIMTFQLSDFALKHWKDYTSFEFTDDNLNKLDYMFYNTGSGSELETLLPTLGEKYKFTSIHVLDIYWSDALNMLSRFPVNPDYSICITNKNRHDIIKATNIPHRRVFAYGNPHFDRLKDFMVESKATTSQPVVSFISQCGIGGTYEEPTGELPQKALLQLKELLDEGSLTELKVYKHPRETPDFCNEHGIKIQDNNQFENMVDADIVISCGSTPHYEANMIGLNTIMFEKNTNLKEKILNKDFDWLIQPSMGVESTARILNWFNEILSKDIKRSLAKQLLHSRG